MADSPTVSEPRTERGKYILMQDYRGNEVYTVTREDILAIEAEAAQLIDVERLGKALRVALGWFPWDSHTPEAIAHGQAAEYARLATQGGPTDD